MKVPDGSRGNTRCPKCGTIFPINKPAPAFEVVEDAPAQVPAAQAPAEAPQPGSRPVTKVAQSEAEAKAAEEPDFEIVEGQPTKRDDEEPRKKKKWDEDDDDDEPKARKKKKWDEDDDDDDDDEYDRSRKKKKKKKRRYEDEEWQPSYARRDAFAKAKIGALLISISLWLYLGSLGVMALFVLINWAGGELSSDVMVLPGLVGLGNWIVAAVGLGFCIAGPHQARGLAIAAVSVAGVHLVLSFLAASERGMGVDAMMGARGRGSSMDWSALVSLLPAVDSLLANLVYNSKALGDVILPILGGMCETARIIILMLVLASLASAARDEGAAEMARRGMFINILVIGAAIVVFLLFMVIMRESKFTSLRTVMNMFFAMITLLYIAHTLSMLVPALAAMQTKNACESRA
jgi:hypothetical protein